MKNSKRIVSIAIAVMILFNILSVVSYATVAEGYGIRITVEADKATYAAGDTVRISVKYHNVIPGHSNIGGGNLGFAWDKDILSFPATADLEAPCTTGLIELGTFSTTYCSAPNVRMSTDADAIGRMDAAEVAYGWDEVKNFSLPSVDVAAGPSYATESEAFAIYLKIADNAPDGTYYYGLVKECLRDSEGYYTYGLNCPELSDYYYPTDYAESEFGYDPEKLFDFSACVATINVGASGPSVATGDIKAQWADQAAGKMNLGFKGTISGADLTLAGIEVTDGLYEVGMVFSANDSTPTIAEGATKVNAYTLYASGTDYLFRAVMRNVPYDSTDSFYVNTFIITADGAEPIYGEPLAATNGAAEYTAAVARGLAAFA